MVWRQLGKEDREWGQIRLTEKVTSEQRPGRSEKIIFYREEHSRQREGQKYKAPKVRIFGDTARRRGPRLQSVRGL